MDVKNVLISWKFKIVLEFKRKKNMHLTFIWLGNITPYNDGAGTQVPTIFVSIFYR